MAKCRYPDSKVHLPHEATLKFFPYWLEFHSHSSSRMKQMHHLAISQTVWSNTKPLIKRITTIEKRNIQNLNVKEQV